MSSTALRQSLDSGAPPPTYTSGSNKMSPSSSPDHTPSSDGSDSLFSASSRVWEGDSAASRALTPDGSAHIYIQNYGRAISPDLDSMTFPTPDVDGFVGLSGRRSEQISRPTPQLLTLTSQGYLLSYPEGHLTSSNFGTPTRLALVNAPPSSIGASEAITLVQSGDALPVPVPAPIPLRQRSKSLSIHPPKTSTTPHLKLNPTNFTSIYRKSTPSSRRFPLFRMNKGNFITGVFAINPYLRVPTELLPPLGMNESERERKNLKLEVENGGIEVEVYLLGTLPRGTIPRDSVSSENLGQDPTTELEGCSPPTGARTTLSMSVCGGGEKNAFPITAKIHTPSSTPQCPPFYLTTTTNQGPATLYLPRSFHGVVTITISIGDLFTHISLSKELAQFTTILTESSTTRAYFIGSMGECTGEDGIDKVDVQTGGGKVSLGYSSPPGDGTEVRRKKGVYGWGFGGIRNNSE